MDLQCRIESFVNETGPSPSTKCMKTEHGVCTFDLERDALSTFRVFTVNEEDADLETLEEAAKLAAFYNAKFFHELVQTERCNLKIARLATTLKKGQVSAYAIVDHSQSTVRMAELGMDELTQVAEQLANLHSILVDEDVRTTINDNHAVVWEQKLSRIERSIDMGCAAVEGELRPYFTHPESIREKLKSLHPNPLSITGRLSVICHGNLTNERCSFNDKGRLIEMTGWENVHTGHPIEDLASLIVTCASPEMRRREYMKIIRHYFYTLVDMRAPHLMLADLRVAFKQSIGAVVLASFDGLIDSLACPVFNHEAKKIITRRWESALDDAYDVAHGDSLSDNEQSFFKSSD